MPGPEPPDPYACPELPASAKVDHERAAEASIFLDDYITFSTKWAPRAYAGFHEAAGLFTLSTTAARRVKIAFGPHGVYTSLYMALARARRSYQNHRGGYRAGPYAPGQARAVAR